MSKSIKPGSTTEDTSSQASGTVNPVPGPHPPKRTLLIVTIVVIVILAIASFLILKSRF